VTLRGKPNSRKFLLTIRGELQPQVVMSGSEPVIAIPMSKEANGKSGLVHHIRPGPHNYFINETVTIENSRFMLKDITDVRLRAVSTMPQEGG
jgi:hypothetical protein